MVFKAPLLVHYFQFGTSNTRFPRVPVGGGWRRCLCKAILRLCLRPRTGVGAGMGWVGAGEAVALSEWIAFSQPAPPSSHTYTQWGGLKRNNLHRLASWTCGGGVFLNPPCVQFSWNPLILKITRFILFFCNGNIYNLVIIIRYKTFTNRI